MLTLVPLSTIALIYASIGYCAYCTTETMLFLYSRTRLLHKYNPSIHQVTPQLHIKASSRCEAQYTPEWRIVLLWFMWFCLWAWTTPGKGKAHCWLRWFVAALFERNTRGFVAIPKTKWFVSRRTWWIALELLDEPFGLLKWSRY